MSKYIDGNNPVDIAKIEENYNKRTKEAEEKAKKIAEGAGWEGSWCYSVKYNSGGYYTCLLKDAKGRTGYVLVGSGTGTILEGAWSDEVVSDDDNEDNEGE